MTTPTLDKLALEFEHLQRQNEKLLIEIQALRATSPSSPWEGRMTRFLPFITTLVGMGGLWFGVIQYAVAEKAADRMREQELAATIFRERKEAYMDLINAACEIAGCMDRAEVKKKAPAFLTIFCGRAHVIAAAKPEVTNQKVKFKDKLLEYLKDETIKEPPFEYFRDNALDLTFECKPFVDPGALEQILQSLRDS